MTGLCMVSKIIQRRQERIRVASLQVKQLETIVLLWEYWWKEVSVYVHPSKAVKIDTTHNEVSMAEAAQTTIMKSTPL